MNTWTLTNAQGTEKSFAEWGLGALERKLVNQGQDEVTFTAPGAAYDGEPLLAYGDTVAIRRDGALWFQGRVIGVPRVGAASAESMRYTIAGPWWYLEDLVFQQQWKQLSDFTNSNSPLADVYRSRVVIGQSEAGAKLNSAQQITEVINFAIAQGRPLQLGAVEPVADFPWDERRDPSCATVIKRVLRWTPDAVTYFDYSTTPPTLHVRNRSSLTAVTIPVNAGAPVESLTITPRNDLQRSVVTLKYEQTNTVDGADFTQLVVDQYPTGSNENAIAALSMTFELSGGNASYQRQQITTAPIKENDVTWWTTKLPWLANLSNVAISGGARSPDNLPNELQKGTVATWMGKQSGMVQVTATLSYDCLSDPQSPVDPVGNPVIERKSAVTITTRVRGTDASSQVYTRLRRLTTSEPVPVGLAQALYNSVSVLSYEGALKLKESECSGTAMPGRMLQLTGGRAEWTSMCAVIQIVSEKIDTGETSIEFGPPNHLGRQDLVRLLQVNRKRRVTYRADERSSGHPAGKAEVDGIDDTPAENSSPGAGQTSRLMLMAAGGGDGSKVTLDVADCNGKELKVRELDICEDGTAKKILVVCSETY